MKKILILLSIIFLMSGCYDYVEIDDLVIVTGILIDYNDNQYEVTSEVIENEKESKVKVFTTKCTTIDECIYKISKLSNKDIFISHLKTLILTESTITSNIDFYDYFLREPKSKMNFNVYYVSDEFKKDILNVYKKDSSTAFYIKDLMEFNNKIFSSSTPLSFLDLVYKKEEYGINPIYPSLEIKKNNDEEIIYLQNLVTFKNKKKRILNDDEGITYNIITNNLIKTVINIPCDNNNFSITLNDTKTKYKWINNKLSLNTKISAKISTYTCKYDLDDPKTINKLSDLTNNYIKKNINNLIKISKEDNNDFLGLTGYIYKHSKKKLKIKDININTKVDTTINAIGEIRK